MANKWEAINNFWNSFTWDAYDENSVDTGDFKPSFPYITYSAQTGSVGQVLTMTASLWDRSSSWKAVSDKADEIAAFIGYGYAISKVDGGYLWIVKGQPFAQRTSDDDDSIKRIYIILSAEFLTAY